MKTVLVFIFSVIQFYSFGQQNAQTHFTNLQEALRQPEKVISLRLNNYSSTVNALPDNFLKLTELKTLFVSWRNVADYAQFFNVLSQLPNLKRLEVECYEDSVLPASIGNMVQLQYLKIKTEKLTMLPPQIEGMISLEELEIDHHGSLQTFIIPKEIGKLYKLKRLDLSGPVDELPREIGDLNALEELNLWGCDLRYLPPTIDQLSNLKSLILSANRFDSIPKEIFTLTSLEELYLSDNKLTYLDNALCQLSNLKGLYLDGNIGIKELPANIGQLTKLEYLDIECTQIKSLSNLSKNQNIQYLNVSRNVIKNKRKLRWRYGDNIDMDFSCDEIEQLTVDFDKKYGKTSTRLLKLHDTLQMKYSFYYNEPNTIDEEYTLNASLVILEKDIRVGYLITIPDSIVTIKASTLSVWNDGGYYQNLQGELMFIQVKKNSVRVRIKLDRKYSNGETYPLIDNKELIFRKRRSK